MTSLPEVFASFNFSSASAKLVLRISVICEGSALMTDKKVRSYWAAEKTACFNILDII